MIKPKFEEANPETEFSLVLSKKHTYDLVGIIFISKLSYFYRCLTELGVFATRLH